MADDDEHWLVMFARGACQDLIPRTPSGPSPTPSLGATIAIEKPVGVGPLARNEAADVAVIQDALNRISEQGIEGGPNPPLAVDGIIGPKTNAAIQRFQQVQLQIFDGVIEPRRTTIIKLNQLLNAVNDDDMKSKILGALPIVQRALQAALDNIGAVISGTDTGVSADRLNRHFLLNTLPASDQSNARIDLFRTYTRFHTAILRTDLFATDLFDEFDLNTNDPFISLVSPDGFFHPLEDKRGRRLDHIHLGLGFLESKVTPDFAAFIIIHELSHLVSRADRALIDDHGRGWFNDQFIRPLSAKKRLANADSYTTFAFECRNQSPTKPAFVQTAPGGLKGRR